MSGKVIEIESQSIEQTMAVGAAIGKLAQAGEVIALSGELGAGKTQMVRGLARGMGLDEREVASPTFVLMREYVQEDGTGLVLVHIDAYRLGEAESMATIGWENEGEQVRAGAVTAVEWAEKVAGVLGDEVLAIRMRHGGSGRIIEIETSNGWAKRLVTLEKAFAKIQGGKVTRWSYDG